jgi:hypothetical protein
MTPNNLHRFQPLIKFGVDRHFIYITTRAYDNKEQLYLYYNLIEEYLEDITKEWSVDLLIPADPAEVSGIDIPEAAENTPRPSKTNKTKKTKKDEEIQDVERRSIRMESITPEKGGNGEYLEEVEQRL